jgi:hypothetical protein
VTARWWPKFRDRLLSLTRGSLRSVFRNQSSVPLMEPSSTMCSSRLSARVENIAASRVCSSGSSQLKVCGDDHAQQRMRPAHRRHPPASAKHFGLIVPLQWSATPGFDNNRDPEVKWISKPYASSVHHTTNAVAMLAMCFERKIRSIWDTVFCLLLSAGLSS